MTGQTEWSRQASKRRRIRDRFIAQARNGGLDCSFCGHRIDPGAPHLDPGELTLDHVVPLSAGGAPFELSNLAAAHRRCNRAAGDKRQARAMPDGRVPTAADPHIDERGGRTWYEGGARVFETWRTW